MTGRPIVKPDATPALFKSVSSISFCGLGSWTIDAILLGLVGSGGVEPLPVEPVGDVGGAVEPPELELPLLVEPPVLEPPLEVEPLPLVEPPVLEPPLEVEPPPLVEPPVLEPPPEVEPLLLPAVVLLGLELGCAPPCVGDKTGEPPSPPPPPQPTNAITRSAAGVIFNAIIINLSSFCPLVAPCLTRCPALFWPVVNRYPI